MDNGLVTEVESGRFEDMVVAALDEFPEELGQLMRNVAVTVEHDSGPPGLLGLYQGIPLTSRTSQYAGGPACRNGGTFPRPRGQQQGRRPQDGQN